MAAQRVSTILSEVNVDIDLASIDELRELLKTIIDTVVVEEEPFSTTVRFNNKHVGKPSVWDGEIEEEFKTCQKKLPHSWQTQETNHGAKFSRRCKREKEINILWTIWRT